MGNSRTTTPEHTFLDDVSATGAGTQMNVADFRHVTLWFATDGGSNADLTVKVQGSISNTAPTWGSAQSVTNQWDYVAMYDLNDPGTIVTGDTGFVVSVADDYKNYIVNADGFKWINVVVTARTDGEVTVKGVGFNNL